MPRTRTRCDILVIGAGPGGMTTALRLAKAGRDVLLVEEGKEESGINYRHGGLATTLTSPRVAFMEHCGLPLNDLYQEYLNLGGRILTKARVKRLYMSGKKITEANCRLHKIRFNHLFICAGAIQTPLLLRRSGIKKNIGNHLRMQPRASVVAAFDAPISHHRQRVSELAAHLWDQKNLRQHLLDAKRHGIFDVGITATRLGKVRALPGLDEAWVDLPMTKTDWGVLHTSLRILKEQLKIEGAKHIYQSKDIEVSARCLYGSCPRGQDAACNAVGDYGKLYQLDNVVINDASIVTSFDKDSLENTVTALAERNVEHFLKYA